ncbi:MAG: hypothetical protein D6785_16080 [Planctomycetota bacterium]|nr:MAG: hypothetical protein D6785_16080 [Planctomycetota bacterium]
MASTRKKFAYLKGVRKLKKPSFEEVPSTSKFYPLWEYLSQADRFGVGKLQIHRLQEDWGLKIDRRRKEEVEIALFGFPDLSESCPLLGLLPPMGEQVEELKKEYPLIHEDFWEYYRYFGEILAFHYFPSQVILFGLSHLLFSLPQGDSKQCREWINKHYWAADEEEFPGPPVLLLGKDVDDSLWFAVEKKNWIWTYDANIQGVRNANYYDDDEDYVEWHQYVPQIIKSWTESKVKHEEKPE